MKILIIDSHKSNDNTDQQNLHWKNAKILSKELNADLIWSYPTVNDHIVTGYNVIIFNHTSRYSYIATEWITENPNAEIYYITNEYNLGEPLVLWQIAKAGRHYNVISNHDSSISKVVKKYVKEWHILNLNALVYEPYTRINNSLVDEFEKTNIIYYGSFRKGRISSYKKYLKDKLILSTHSSNLPKFREIGCYPFIGKRVEWPNEGIGLDNYKFSFYMEDDINHNNYNHLANRFYEALNHNVLTLFDTDCRKNLLLSGYDIPEELIVDGYDDLMKQVNSIDNDFINTTLEHWKTKAAIEKTSVLATIKQILNG
jgi:hypothetical protein